MYLILYITYIDRTKLFLHFFQGQPHSDSSLQPITLPAQGVPVCGDGRSPYWFCSLLRPVNPLASLLRHMPWFRDGDLGSLLAPAASVPFTLSAHLATAGSSTWSLLQSDASPSWRTPLNTILRSHFLLKALLPSIQLLFLNLIPPFFPDFLLNSLKNSRKSFQQHQTWWLLRFLR